MDVAAMSLMDSLFFRCVDIAIWQGLLRAGTVIDVSVIVRMFQPSRPESTFYDQRRENAVRSVARFVVELGWTGSQRDANATSSKPLYLARIVECLRTWRLLYCACFVFVSSLFSELLLLLC